jgi:hypothetical protein
MSLSKFWKENVNQYNDNVSITSLNSLRVLIKNKLNHKLIFLDKSIN